MNLKVLSLSGLGVLGVGAVGAGGIAMSVGGGQGSEETAKPSPAPTISQKLSNKGYIYNPPKLSSHDKLVQSCTENLLNKEGLESSKLYGCGVAKLDLWDSGNQFGSTTIDYLNFASEIFIRKGNDGWRINTRINNSSGDLIYQHLLTHYKKRNGKNLEIEGVFLINVGSNYGPDKDPRSVSSKDQSFAVGVATADKKLNIKLPDPKGQWYQGDNYAVMKSDASNLPNLEKVYKGNKTWSGIWIDNSPADKPWMFKDIEVFIGNMTYSQVFCKGVSCGNGRGNKLYKSERSQGSPTSPDVWWEAEQKFLDQGIGSSTDTSKPRKSILDFVKDSKGEWVDANEFCKGGDELEINNEKLENLKLYCSKTKA